MSACACLSHDGRGKHCDVRRPLSPQRRQKASEDAADKQTNIHTQSLSLPSCTGSICFPLKANFRRFFSVRLSLSFQRRSSESFYSLIHHFIPSSHHDSNLGLHQNCCTESTEKKIKNEKNDKGWLSFKPDSKWSPQPITVSKHNHNSVHLKLLG